MHGIKELLDLLEKLKDTRLNLSIFIVAGIFLSAEKNNLIEAGNVLFPVAQACFLATSIRLVFALLGKFSDAVTDRKEKLIKAHRDTELAAEVDRKVIQSINALENCFNQLDVFQLFVVQELRRQNSVSVAKGAVLFSLIKLGVVSPVSSGERTQSVEFTAIAKKIADEAFWERFDSLKRNSLVRYFKGLGKVELERFLYFSSRDYRDGKIHGKGLNTHYDFYHTYKACAVSIVFIQPQLGSKFYIDKVAQSVLKEIEGLSTPVEVILPE